MRYAVYTVAALNLAWFLAFAISPPSFPDAAGQGWVTLIGLILAAFHIPALILTVSRKVEWLALILVLIPLLYFLNGMIRARLFG